MKSIKVFKDGVYLRDIYPHATKFQVMKYRVAQFVGRIVRKVVLWLKLGATASVAMAVGAFLYGNYIGVSTQSVFANVVSEDTLSMKIDSMQSEIVDKIANLENKNHIPGVYDDNKTKSLPAKDKVSYGCMQMKISTIQLFNQQLGKGKISDLDAVLMALDCEKAKAFSKEAIFNIQGALWHWSTATKEMGTKVEIIKSMMK